MRKLINLTEKLAEKTFQINSKINHKYFYFNNYKHIVVARFIEPILSSNNERK
ncbi:MAG: hypothetical protein HY934_00610 [Candidatus Firestonebacteria bacterium]|nr:hypothetical protein [Candidatus Firestonebacteria bacterium]